MENNNLENSKKRGKVYFINTLSSYLPAIAEQLGYEYKLGSIDLKENLLKDIFEYSPNYIVSYVGFEKFRTSLRTLESIKQAIPSCIIIVFGEPFITYNTNVTYENPFIDYVMVGEAEYTLRDILDGEANPDIMGICYTDENMQAAKNEQRPLIENLDELPCTLSVENNKSTIAIEVSRGCPYHCFFCLSSIKNGTAVRLRTAESIVNELKACKEKYGSKNFYFKSDIFNFDYEWVKNLCESIINSNLKINWSCDIVPKGLDEELVKLMKKSGCSVCNVGAESGSKEILEKLKKGITNESIAETVNLLKKNKIKVNSYFLLGLPWETEDTAKETINFAKRLRSNSTVFNLAIPFPGTKFFVYSMLNKLLPPILEVSDEENLPLAKSHKLSRERIIELKNKADKIFLKNKLFNNFISIFKFK